MFCFARKPKKKSNVDNFLPDLKSLGLYQQSFWDSFLDRFLRLSLLWNFNKNALKIPQVTWHFFPWLRQLCYRRSFFDFLIYCWIESSWIMMLLWLRVIPGGMKCPAGELVVPLGTSARDIYFCSVVLLYDGKYEYFNQALELYIFDLMLQ